ARHPRHGRMTNALRRGLVKARDDPERMNTERSAALIIATASIPAPAVSQNRFRKSSQTPSQSPEPERPLAIHVADSVAGPLLEQKVSHRPLNPRASDSSVI